MNNNNQFPFSNHYRTKLNFAANLEIIIKVNSALGAILIEMRYKFNILVFITCLLWMLYIMLSINICNVIYYIELFILCIATANAWRRLMLIWWRWRKIWSIWKMSMKAYFVRWIAWLQMMLCWRNWSCWNEMKLTKFVITKK